jgi:hypothetical protein
MQIEALHVWVKELRSWLREEIRAGWKPVRYLRGVMQEGRYPQSIPTQRGYECHLTIEKFQSLYDFRYQGKRGKGIEIHPCPV